MKFILLLTILAFCISCSNQQENDIIKDRPKLVTFTHIDGPNMELCFDQRLDGYLYELELVTKSGRQIISTGVLTNGQNWVNTQTCYSLKEPQLPDNIFDPSSMLKTLNWKILGTEENNLVAEGTKDVELKSLIENLEEQENEKPDKPWPHTEVKNYP